jgi:hypothetical protein
MKNSPFFSIYGAVLLALFSMAEYTGFGFFGPNAEKGGPKTIRDNPGASRSHYSGYNRYVGGK